MTHLSLSQKNSDRPSLAGEDLAQAGGLILGAARLIRRVVTGACRPIVILIAYRAALKRLEASVDVDLFDDPVLWAELKSVAWAEATRQEWLRIP
jgi:hypothetical protein